MTEERQATTVRLTRPQLKWIKDQAFERRVTQQDVVEQAICAAGAPRALASRSGSAMDELNEACKP
jgi:hypothetical protein